MGSIWHIGIAVPDLAKGQKELSEVFGLRCAGTLIELCDLHSDRPSLRDLFPPGSEFASELLPGSAL